MSKCTPTESFYAYPWVSVLCLCSTLPRTSRRRGELSVAPLPFPHSVFICRRLTLYLCVFFTTRRIHEVPARRFCLVAADHPLVSAIQENRMSRRVSNSVPRPLKHIPAHISVFACSQRRSFSCKFAMHKNMNKSITLHLLKTLLTICRVPCALPCIPICTTVATSRKSTILNPFEAIYVFQCRGSDMLSFACFQDDARGSCQVLA